VCDVVTKTGKVGVVDTESRLHCEKTTMLLKSFRSAHVTTSSKRYVLNSVLATIGYILSPLSWWNDMVVNVPLAYAFSIPFTFISEQLFLPSFIAGYWLSNFLGFILIHKGVTGLVRKRESRLGLKHQIVISLLYTAIIVIMVWVGWLPLPTELINAKT